MLAERRAAATHTDSALREPAWLRWTLIALVVLAMLGLIVLPLAVVMVEALAQGFLGYLKAIGDAETLAAIVRVHFPDIKDRLLSTALTQFFEVREMAGLKKKPSTSEVLDWLKLLLAADLAPEDLRRDARTNLPRLHGALLKNEQDVQLFERLAFLSRKER